MSKSRLTNLSLPNTVTVNACVQILDTSVVRIDPCCPVRDQHLPVFFSQQSLAELFEYLIIKPSADSVRVYAYPLMRARGPTSR